LLFLLIRVGSVFHPWRLLAVPVGPARLLAHAAKYEPTFLGRQVVDGVPAAGVWVKNKQTGEVFAFGLDPARGFLPARLYGTTTDGLVIQYYLLEARECSNQRWFPGRVLKVRPPHKPGALFGVQEMKVLELDADDSLLR
jgi:hypothetical protein